MTDASHDIAATSNRSSIDLSLELERQLDLESLPSTPALPAHFKDAHNRTSLDPHVLAHIVTQLRDSLTHLSQERDDLVYQLAASHTREAEFKDSLALCTERCASLEKDLESARRKNQDDDEAISMLRSKVEESRRGLMRLQSERTAENKRMTLDFTHSRPPSFGGGPRSSHRASFTPLAGSGHPGPPPSYRRLSSNTSTVSENDPGFAEFVASLPGSPGQTPLFNESTDSDPTNSTLGNRRRSMFGAVNRSSSNYIEGHSNFSGTEIESLKRELLALKAELEETRHELTESNEAREASESCVKALRDFIGQVGGGGDTSGSGQESVRLPPLPTDSGVKDLEAAPKAQKSSGWGLKLWTGSSASSTIQTPTTTPSVRRPSMDSYRTMGSENDSASPSTAVPLRNKLGFFFARGTSISSFSHPPPDLHQEEPMLNGSDVSSLTEDMSEPISPAVEKTQTVFVQESTGEDGGATNPNINDKGAVYIQAGAAQGDASVLKALPT
ncbi:hypothetical protein K439DRAFT_931590 [Ramaria rubella]|nr:hypothetical protein K439DRAFT_931590 [Ramaria rubella]